MTPFTTASCKELKKTESKPERHQQSGFGILYAKTARDDFHFFTTPPAVVQHNHLSHNHLPKNRDNRTSIFTVPSTTSSGAVAATSNIAVAPGTSVQTCPSPPPPFPAACRDPPRPLDRRVPPPPHAFFPAPPPKTTSSRLETRPSFSTVSRTSSCGRSDDSRRPPASDDDRSGACLQPPPPPPPPGDVAVAPEAAVAPPVGGQVEPAVAAAAAVLWSERA